MSSMPLNCSSSWDRMCQPLNSDVKLHDTTLCADAAVTGVACWIAFYFRLRRGWSRGRQQAAQPASLPGTECQVYLARTQRCSS